MADVIAADFFREFINIGARSYSVYNFFNIAGTQHIVFAHFGKAFGSINYKYIGVIAFLFKHHNNGWYTGAEKDVGRQADNSIDVVVFY